MSFLTARKAMALLCLLLLAAGPSLAQKLATHPSDEKERGEQYNIDQRRQWFIESRGLDSVDRPDEYRRRATQHTRRMRENQRAQSRAADHQWVEVGPSPMSMLSWAIGNVAGRVSAIEYDPSNTDTIYLGTAAGGVWKTTDGGANWTSLFDDIGTTTIGSLFVDPNNSDNVWAGTGDHWASCYSYQGMGLFASTDGGSTWTAKNGSGANTLDLTFIAAIAVHPTNPQIMMVGGLGYCAPGDPTNQAGGLYRTTDGGANWTRVITGSVQDIKFDSSDPNTYYASVGDDYEAVNGVYKSTNSGANWTRLQSGILYGTNIGRIHIAMAPSDNQTLYALANRAAGGTYLYQSTNGGSSWTLKNTNACEGQCSYNLCLDVHPTNPNTILVGSIRFALSTNGGSSLSYQTSSWGSGQTVHQDTHVLKFHPTNGNTYWVGCDGGIWQTTNNGGSFNNLNANLNITQFYDIAVDPTDPATILGGSQDNSSERTTGSIQWEVTVVSGDGFMNLVDPLNPNVVYQTSYAYTSGSGKLPRIYRSTSGGAPGTMSTLSNTGISAGPFAWVVPLAVAADQGGNTSYIFCGSNRPYRRADNASRWTSMANNGVTGSAELSTINATPYNNDMTVYVGNYDGEIYRTDNGLASSPSWTNVTGNYPDDIKVSDIAVDPTNPMRVFITRSGFANGQLFSSTTGGTTWTQVGSGLPDVPANAVSIDSADLNRIFVGTDVGVYQSYDGGNTFTVMMDGMPLGVPVTDLEITSTPHTITAGTYGRGAWQSILSSGGNTAPTVNITAPSNGTTVTYGTAISFNGSASDAEDGSLSGSISWSSDLDGNLGSGASVNATLSVGTHTITASVTDSGSLSANDAISVTVNSVGNQPPNASFTHTTSGLTASFSDGSSDPDGSVVGWSWSFGDGGSSSSASPSHTYGTSGTYTVSLTVTDNDGASDTNTTSVTVTGGCTNEYTGSLSYAGDYDAQPNGTYFYHTGGTLTAHLEGPAGTDFDLKLMKWTGSWTAVAQSISPTSIEDISSNQGSGYYYWRVESYSGTGSYTLCLD